MFESYCYLNHEICFEIKNGDDIYLIPRIEDVQKFIHLISSNVGLKTYEKELLLFLDKHLKSLPVKDNVTEIFLTAEDIYNEIEEKTYKSIDYMNSTTKSMVMNKLMSKHGIPKTKKEAELGNKQDKHFFIASTVNRRFNNKEVRNIGDLGNCLSDLSIRGFIGKLEEKKGKANVYYLDKEVIKNLKSSYILDKKDITKALDHLKEINNQTGELIDKETFLSLEDNYMKTNVTKIKNYS